MIIHLKTAPGRYSFILTSPIKGGEGTVLLANTLFKAISLSHLLSYLHFPFRIQIMIPQDDLSVFPTSS